MEKLLLLRIVNIILINLKINAKIVKKVMNIIFQNNSAKNKKIKMIVNNQMILLYTEFNFQILIKIKVLVLYIDLKIQDFI